MNTSQPRLLRVEVLGDLPVLWATFQRLDLPDLEQPDLRHLWRQAKRVTQANRPPQPIEQSAWDACWYLLNPAGPVAALSR
jgi:hypothetical protein